MDGRLLLNQSKPNFPRTKRTEIATKIITSWYQTCDDHDFFVTSFVCFVSGWHVYTDRSRRDAFYLDNLGERSFLISSPSLTITCNLLIFLDLTICHIFNTQFIVKQLKLSTKLAARPSLCESPSAKHFLSCYDGWNCWTRVYFKRFFNFISLLSPNSLT